MCEHPTYAPVAELGVAELSTACAPNLVLLDLEGIPARLRRAIVADLAEALQRHGEWETCQPIQPRPTGRSVGAGRSAQVVLRPCRTGARPVLRAVVPE